MNTTLNQLAPDIVQAIAAQANARGLSASDYLRQLLGLTKSPNNTNVDNTNVEPAHVNPRAEPPPRNEAMFAVLQRSAERMKDVPVSGSTEETLQMIRAARGGKMWGYEPTE